MKGLARGALGLVAALLLPACTVTYTMDQPTAPGGGNLPFILLLPADGELQALTNPQLSWNAYPGAIAYQLEISTASDFSTVVWEDSALTITSTFLTQVTLTNATTFFWRINAVLVGGGKVPAAGSPFQFRTQGGGFTTPTPFATLYPTPGLNNVVASPNFAWQGSIGADSYTLELDTAGTFITPTIVLAGIHVNRATLPPLNPSTQYAWRVVAFGQLGNRASDLPAAVFTTAP